MRRGELGRGLVGNGSVAAYAAFSLIRQRFRARFVTLGHPFSSFSISNFDRAVLGARDAISAMLAVSTPIATAKTSLEST